MQLVHPTQPVQLLQCPVHIKQLVQLAQLPVQLAQLPVQPLLQPPVQLPLQLVQLDAHLKAKRKLRSLYVYLILLQMVLDQHFLFCHHILSNAVGKE